MVEPEMALSLLSGIPRLLPNLSNASIIHQLVIIPELLYKYCFPLAMGPIPRVASMVPHNETHIAHKLTNLPLALLDSARTLPLTKSHDQIRNAIWNILSQICQ